MHVNDFLGKLRDVSIYAPELPEADAYETLELVRERERLLIIGDPSRAIREADYATGTAQNPDEIGYYNADGLTLVTADHATDPFRKKTGKREDADHGTGGLALLAADYNNAAAAIMLGEQTGNPTVTPNHPLKQLIAKELPSKAGYVSVHGMMPGKVMEQSDETEIHALIGLGRTPNELSRDRAERIVHAAKDLNLRVLIGNDAHYMTRHADTGDVALDEADEPKRSRLAALGAGSTVNFANDLEAGVPVIQLELTRGLRLLPEDFQGKDGWHSSEKARAIGVHLGYKMLQLTIDILAAETRGR